MSNGTFGITELYIGPDSRGAFGAPTLQGEMVCHVQCRIGREVLQFHRVYPSEVPVGWMLSQAKRSLGAEVANKLFDGIN